MKKLFTTSLIAIALFGAIGMHNASAATYMSLPELIELLIQVGVIAPDKADIARAAVASKPVASTTKSFVKTASSTTATIVKVITVGTTTATTTTTVTRTPVVEAPAKTSPVNTPVVQPIVLMENKITISRIGQPSNTVTVNENGSKVLLGSLDFSKNIKRASATLNVQSSYYPVILQVWSGGNLMATLEVKDKQSVSISSLSDLLGNLIFRAQDVTFEGSISLTIDSLLVDDTDIESTPIIFSTIQTNR